jgi:hypothetical protein
MNEQVLRIGRRIAIAIVGGLVVLAGLALGPIPGPGGIPVILLGLGILSLEFKRPRAWLAQLKAQGAELKRRFDERRSRPPDTR